jgi:hypothetical protein
MMNSRSFVLTALVFSLFCLCLIATLPAAATTPVQVPAQTAAKAPDADHQLWTATIEPIFPRPVTTSAQAYYSGEVLLVPVHAAFSRNDPEWEKEFADYFKQFMQAPDQITDVELSRLQFLYLASQFVVLAQKSHHAELIPSRLPDLLFSEIQTAWLEKPAGQWEHPFFKGIRERTLWKLNTHNVAKSYFRGIMDDDFFVFAIAADLRNYGGTPEQQQTWRDPLNDILGIAHRVYAQEITPTSVGGWVLQPGVWTDHPDFQYAGNDRAEPGIRPKPVRDITLDSSHSARFPLWLISMRDAYGPGSEAYEFYDNLRFSLAKQFFAKVLVPPASDSPCYRLNNYMDGRNGPYRWGYAEFGPNSGYGPYQVSGALLIGTWVFLKTEETKSLYRNLARQYPWPAQCIALYYGPNRGGAPYTDKDLDPQLPAMRLRYFIVKLASEL